MKTIAIIPAGGSGRRLKTDLSKQYLMLDNLPILVHTLKVFQLTAAINEIILVVPKGDISFVRDEFIQKYGLSKVTNIVAGGKERQDSVHCGIKAIEGKCGVVVIHDAVRPFVTQKIIQQVIAATKYKPAVSCGVKVKDTVKETKDSGLIVKTLPRQHLWLTQTPQAFRLSILEKAYAAAEWDNFYGTDDASLVERLGIDVKMLTGSYDNIKITTPEDLIFAEALLKSRAGGKMQMRSGFGYDSHRLVQGRKLVLGGVEIDYEKGLEGHSDADALIHAVCDALLGSAGLGDIGRHFPDTDPSYQGISSMILLDRVCKMIAAKKFVINNIDATVVMEKPKLAPFVDKIVAGMADVLKIRVTDVNIKAKTNEGMGFIGRKEGVAVYAVATVVRKGAHCV